MFEELFEAITNSNCDAVMDALEELSLRPDVDRGALQKLYEAVAEKQDAMARAGL